MCWPFFSKKKERYNYERISNLDRISKGDEDFKKYLKVYSGVDKV